MNRTSKRIAALAMSGALVTLAACSSSGGSSDKKTKAATADSSCAAFTQYGNLKGKTVSMYSAIVTPQDKPFIDSFKSFESCTGAKVSFQGDQNFDSQVQVRIKGGNPPDLAVFAQPGLIKQLAASGKAAALPAAAAANLKKYWSSSWQGYASNAGSMYAVPLDANVKSFVWYSPKEFASKGWTVPTTLDELKTLSDKIANSGTKPWCMGIAAGDATGWPVTDWMSEMLLRLSGPETYDKWVNHEIPFDGPDATAALNAAGDYIKNPKYVNGGFGNVKSIATTNWQDAGKPITHNQCAMYKQGSFYASMWPKGTKVAPDGDIWAFYFPAKDTSSKPITGGGSFLVAFSKRPEVQALETYMSSPDWINAKLTATPDGGWVSASTGADASKLTNQVDALSEKILQDPKTVFRYTGSDLMPGAVGTDSFWKQSTAWILGKSTADALKAIEKSWPGTS